MNTELKTLITLLITEIKTTLNIKIDFLNEKLNQQQEENKKLIQENIRLQHIIAEQGKQIATSGHQIQTKPVSTTTRPQITPPRPRGIKAHNLLIFCQEKGNDPMLIAQEIFLKKYHKKPAINSAKFLKGNEDSGETISEKKILVTLNSIWEAKAIYRDRVQMLKNSGIFISEDLNRDESFLFYLARKLRKQKRIASTWTEDGVVYIKERPDAPPRMLKMEDQILEEVKTSHQNTPPPQPQPTATPETPTLSLVPISLPATTTLTATFDTTTSYPDTASCVTTRQEQTTEVLPTNHNTSDELSLLIESAVIGATTRSKKKESSPK